MSPSMTSLTVALALLASSTSLLASAEPVASAPASIITPPPVKRQEYSTTYTGTTPATSPLPLTDYFYPYSAIPYQVNPYPVLRGPQSGYNQCNGTTEGPNALCQTAEINSIDDFCLWGAPGLAANETIGDVEAAVVAYCTKSGHGARIFPPGTFTAVQFMKTPAYIQVVGLYNQTAMGLAADDYGGELDPHGADSLGNPLGGLVYSFGLASGDNSSYVQSQSWTNFVGGNIFCFKVCDPSYSTDLNYCQNIFDLIGCGYNMPAAYAPGQFLSCEGDLQDEVGTYTSAGQTYTWSQPSVLPATSTLPWTPRIPASSNCVTYASSDLFPLSSLGYQSTNNVFGAVATATSAASSGASTGSSSSSGTAAKTGSTATGTSAKATGTTASGTAAASATSAASSGEKLSGTTSFGVMAAVMAALTAFLA